MVQREIMKSVKDIIIEQRLSLLEQIATNSVSDQVYRLVNNQVRKIVGTQIGDNLWWPLRIHIYEKLLRSFLSVQQTESIHL